jgi:fumarate hydratase class I
MGRFTNSLYELIVQTSSNLPDDVRAALNQGLAAEKPDTRADLALQTIAVNVNMACDNELPICQDTGLPTFKIKCPVGFNQIEFKKDILEAIEKATKLGKLRPNSVDPVTGKNTGDNLGPQTPVVYFEQWQSDDLEVRLILKGGGCENKNIQYSLPTEVPGLGRAGRDMDGIRKCVMHAVQQAQGLGCSAGFIGVGIGGDRTSGYTEAKNQLFRSLDDVNPDPELARLEDYVMKNANTLDIGTMGFGGNVTLLGCKIGKINRIPASFFVSVAYNCWAFRRLGVTVDADSGDIRKWHYRRSSTPVAVAAKSEGIPLTGKEVVLQTPVSEEQIRSLKVGDIVLVEGDLYTGRDEIHHYLMTNDAPVDLNGGILYHCGPVMLKDENDQWTVKAAGPTTSMREEPYQADIIKKFGLRAVIGKGGMGDKTLAGLKAHGAVYLNAIGGAAQYYAESLPEVKNVYFLEKFGIPEAMWHFKAKAFPAIVTMDAFGNSLHKEVFNASMAKLELFEDKKL